MAQLQAEWNILRSASSSLEYATATAATPTTARWDFALCITDRLTAFTRSQLRQSLSVFWRAGWRNESVLHKHVASNRPETPVIVTTGYADVPMSVQARNAGAFDFLTKPFRNRTLLAGIRDALERSRRATPLD